MILDIRLYASTSVSCSLSVNSQLLMLFVFLLLVVPVLGLKNTNVTRTIRFKGNIVKIHHDILLSETPAKYQLVIEEREWKHLSFIGASVISITFIL